MLSSEHLHRIRTLCRDESAFREVVELLDAAARKHSQFVGIIDSAMDAIVSQDAAGNIVLFNPAAAKMFGYSASEMLGQPLELLLPSRFRRSHAHQIRNFAASHTTQRSMHDLGHVVGLRADGTEFPLEASISQVEVDGQKIFTAIMRDLTHVAQAKAELERRNRELEAMNTMMLALGSEQAMESVLETLLVALANIIAYDSASIALLEQDELVLVAAKGLPRGFDFNALGFSLRSTLLTRNLLDSPDPILIQDVKNDPRWITIPALAYIRSWIGVPLVSHGKTIGILHLDKKEPSYYTPTHVHQLIVLAKQVATAIENAQLFKATQHYANELELLVDERTQELEHERTQLKIILENMDEGVVHGKVTQILYANAAFSRLTGYSPEELTTDPDIFNRLTRQIPQDRLMELVEAHQKGGTWRGEVKLVHKDGRLLDVAFTSTGILDTSNLYVGNVTLMRDIHQEKTLREQKERFIANAAHELRNPIAALVFKAQLIDKDTANLLQNAESLRELAEHMSRLVDNLLDLSRFERGMMQFEFQEVDLHTVIQKVYTMYSEQARRKSIRMNYQVIGEPSRVKLDVNRMVQVVGNLLINAINYTPEGGRIDISLRSLHGVVQVWVEDTGKGIPPEYLPDLIFEPFSRAQTTSAVKGLGLGLAISREIILQHGGKIWAESEVGKGSLFVVELPNLNGVYESL